MTFSSRWVSTAEADTAATVSAIPAVRARRPGRHAATKSAQ